jgi:hypothetical protein
MPSPTHYYLIRSPDHVGLPFTGDRAGIRRNNKRDAIATAKAEARIFVRRTPVRARRVSVYTVEDGKRPTLLYQCHIDLRNDRIVSEEL